MSEVKNVDSLSDLIERDSTAHTKIIFIFAFVFVNCNLPDRSSCSSFLLRPPSLSHSMISKHLLFNDKE